MGDLKFPVPAHMMQSQKFGGTLHIIPSVLVQCIRIQVPEEGKVT